MAKRSQALGPQGISLWCSATDSSARVASDGNGGRHNVGNQGWGLGFDYHTGNKRWTLGAGAGRQDGTVKLDARASRAETASEHLAAYARYGSDAAGWNVLGSLVIARVEADVTRHIAYGGTPRTVSDSPELSSTAGTLEVRYGWEKGKLAFGPLARMDHVATRLNNVTETGASSLNLSSGGKRERWSQTGLGGFARYQLARGFGELAISHIGRDNGATQLDMRM